MGRCAAAGPAWGSWGWSGVLGLVGVGPGGGLLPLGWGEDVGLRLSALGCYHWGSVTEAVAPVLG